MYKLSYQVLIFMMLALYFMMYLNAQLKDTQSYYLFIFFVEYICMQSKTGKGLER